MIAATYLIGIIASLVVDLQRGLGTAHPILRAVAWPWFAMRWLVRVIDEEVRK